MKANRLTFFILLLAIVAGRFEKLQTDIDFVAIPATEDASLTAIREQFGISFMPNRGTFTVIS